MTEEKTDSKPVAYGYRKVFVCIAAIIAVAVLVYFDKPFTADGVKYIAGIAALYCGVNTWRNRVDAQAEEAKLINEERVARIRNLEKQVSALTVKNVS